MGSTWPHNRAPPVFQDLHFTQGVNITSDDSTVTCGWGSGLVLNSYNWSVSTNNIGVYVTTTVRTRTCRGGGKACSDFSYVVMMQQKSLPCSGRTWEPGVQHNP